MTENELFQFYDKTTVNKQNDKIPVGVLFELLGIDADNQIKMIEEHPILSTYFSIQNEKHVFTKKGFLMYVLWLSLEFVPEKQHDNFKLYQEFLVDSLYNDTINREQLTREKINLKKQLEQLEVEMQQDERFLKIALLKEQLKQTDTHVKQLNSKLVANIQTTLDL